MTTEKTLPHLGTCAKKKSQQKEKKKEKKNDKAESLALLSRNMWHGSSKGCKQ